MEQTKNMQLPTSINGKTPKIILLKDGTDKTQGKGQLMSNIKACNMVADTIRTTLGPRGMDKLIVNSKGHATISNDGATIVDLLEITHPAARSFVDMVKAQDIEVGDGTTSVVLIASEILKELVPLIESGLETRLIIVGIWESVKLLLAKLDELSIRIPKDDPVKFRDMLEICASISMSSKIISTESPFLNKLVVDAVTSLDDDMDLKMIGIKSVKGGAIEDTRLIKGVAFKKTFSYAGFEQQPKLFKNPKIIILNIELELKAERDNAEIRIQKVQDYQDIVNTEWNLFYEQLDSISSSGANVVLSSLPIGDLATQYFAEKSILCLGRVPKDDLERIIASIGGRVLSTTSNILPSDLGACGLFEEVQLGAERYNLMTSCPLAKSCTILVRGGSDQLIEEIKRSLHDAISIVKRTIQNTEIVVGGGAIEMELSKYLRAHAHTIPNKLQLIIMAVAKALEIIPKQLCHNSGLDPVLMMNALRKEHAQGNVHHGINITTESVSNNYSSFIWEPTSIKRSALKSAASAITMLLSVDEVIQAPKPN